MAVDATDNRITFFDNLRYLMVLLVVVLHAANSYTNFVPYWSVKEANQSSLFFDILLLILDAFLMPVLYFIAGFFAIPPFRAKGFRFFCKRKLIRLGLPLLLAIPVISPFSAYVHHYTRNGYSYYLSFGEYWLRYMMSFADIKVRLLISMDQFGHSHLWFMSLLLFFFIVFAVVAQNRVLAEEKSARVPQGGPSAKTIWGVLIAVAILPVAGHFSASLIFASPANPEPWVSIGNLLQFQTNRLVAYIVYFIFGVIAYHKNWIQGDRLPGRPLGWIVACIVLVVCYLIALDRLLNQPTPEVFLAYLFARWFLCFMVLMVAIKWAIRKWNRPSRTDALLASNSYFIYITHFPIVIALQLVVSFWSGGPVFVKFFIVAAGSICLSYGFSQYVLKPYPRLAVMGVYALMVILCFGFNPTG